MDKKGEYLSIFEKYIKRSGADELKNYLLRSDFFQAPASTRYHCAFEGGLCEHSVNVYKRLLAIVQNEYGDGWEKVYSHETVAVCGLLHDLCKIDFYKQDYRNVKENGEWIKKPYFMREETSCQNGDFVRTLCNQSIPLRLGIKDISREQTENSHLQDETQSLGKHRVKIIFFHIYSFIIINSCLFFNKL